MPAPASAIARTDDSHGLPTALDDIESVARIGSYALDVRTGVWTSSRGLDAIFGIDDTYERTVTSWSELVHPADREGMVTYFLDDVVRRATPFDRQYRIVRPSDGEVRWVHGRGRLELDDVGNVARMLGTIADISDLVRMQRQDVQLARAVASTLEGVAITDPRGLVEYANPAFERLTGYMLEEIAGTDARDYLAVAPGTLEELRATSDTGEAWTGDIVISRRDGTPATLHATVSPVRTSRGGLDGFVTLVRDVTAERVREAERTRLVAAVEQTSDSVVITDLSGTIEYVNPAFERITGFSREEAVGQNPRILKSGRQSAAFYRALWRRLVRGEPWSGTLVNRRRDGTEFEEEATISPIVEGGEATGYIAVKRDVTSLHIVETALAREVRERAQIRASLARLQPRPSPEATAEAIVDELLAIPGVDGAAIFDFPGSGAIRTLALGGPPELQKAGAPLQAARAADLRVRAEQGPWAESWPLRSEDGTPPGVGSLRAIAYAPIRNGGGLLGLVAAATCDEEFARHLVDHLPIVGEFAAAASALLAREMERAHGDEALRRRIYRILADGAFHPVFQPIVDLSNGATIAHEALTRFEDGTPPDRMFAEAHAVGLGVELEVACVAAAIDEAASLPDDAWLSVNVSPAALLGRSRLASVVQRWARPLVIEVTEHVEVQNYAPIRRAVHALGPSVRLAVDDAGSGFASFRHVLELGPRYVKLDRALVQDVHRDPARQAMLFGLAAFAARVGCQLVAEGIEQAAELNALRELGITLGQGYYLGRPEPIEE